MQSALLIAIGAVSFGIRYDSLRSPPGAFFFFRLAAHRYISALRSLLLGCHGKLNLWIHLFLKFSTSNLQ